MVNILGALIFTNFWGKKQFDLQPKGSIALAQARITTVFFLPFFPFFSKLQQHLLHDTGHKRLLKKKLLFFFITFGRNLP